MAFSFNPERAAFDHDGLAFAGGKPRVVLLLGAEEREVVWSPTTAATVLVRTRQTPLGEATEHTFRWLFMDGFALEWVVSCLKRWPGFSVRTVFINNSTSPVRLRTLGMLHGEAPALRADTADWFLASGLGGWSDQPEGPLAGFAGGQSALPDFASVYSRQGTRGMFLAAVGPAESDATFTFTAAKDGYGLSVTSEMTDIVVDPGERRTSEEALFLFAPHPEAADAAMRWIAATHGARIHRGPFTGWCSWYEQYSNVSAAHVQAVAGAVRRNREVIPQAVIQIDEGYQRHWGDWRTHDRFPDGWKPVVDAIRSAGAIPGVWIAPLGVYDATGLFQEHMEWFQFLPGGPVEAKWRENAMHYLDPTHPDAQQFIRSIIRNAMAEGFRYYKIDFNCVMPCRFHDPKATRFQALRRLYQLYREEMGEDVYLNSCVARLDRAVMGRVDAMRIGADSDYQWPWILKAIRGTAQAAPANGLIMAADPDVFYTKTRTPVLSWQGSVTLGQLQGWQGFVGLLGGLAMTSEPLHKPEYAASLRELEILTPPVPERGRSFLPGMETYPSLFGFVAERPWGSFASVMLFNARETSGDIPLSAPALNALGECHLWSCRDGVYLGRSSGQQHVERALPPWGSRLIRMTPVEPDGKPVLIGSDLHIGMGAAEVAGWTVSPDTLTLVLNDAGARSGALWIHSDKPLVLETATHCEATVEADRSNVWRVQISNRRRGEGQTLRLAVNRPVKEPIGLEARTETAAPVTLKLTPVKRPQKRLQGQPGVDGMVNLTIANPGNTSARGEVIVATAPERFATLTPARVSYRLEPGETVTHTIAVTPRHYALSLILDARRVDAPRSAVRNLLAMERLGIQIPSAGNSWEALRKASEQTAWIPLPGDPAVAKVRMAASAGHLFVNIRVDDAHPAPSVKAAWWEGSCVELFAAMPESKEIRQFYFQPDEALSRVRSFQVVGTGSQEASPGLRAEMERVPEGYEMRLLLSRGQLGIPESAREFLLDFQVSRLVAGRLQNIPLLGGPGASACSDAFARVTIVGDSPA